MGTFVTSVKIIGTDDASPSFMKAAAANDSFVSSVQAGADQFARIRTGQEQVDADWIAAVEENAARMRAAEESKAREAEAAAKRIEAATERQKEKLIELGRVASEVASGGGIAGALGGVGGLLGVGLAAAGLEHMVEKTQEEAIELGHLSTATSISVKELAEFRQELARTGAEHVNLNMIVMRMAAAVQAARNPTSRQAEAFRELGVSADTLKEKEVSLFDVQGQMAKHLQDSTRATQDLGNIRLIAGRNAVPYIAFLKEEGAELTTNMERHHALGDAMDAAVAPAKRLKEAEANMHELWMQLSASSLPAVNIALRAVTETLDFLGTLAADIGLRFQSSFKAWEIAAVSAAHVVSDAARGQVGLAVYEAKEGNKKILAIDQELADARKSLWDQYHKDVAARSAAGAEHKPTGKTDVDPIVKEKEEELDRRARLAQEGRDRDIENEEKWEQVVLKIQHEGAEQQLKAAESNERGLEQITRRRTKFILDAAKEQHHAYEEDQKLDEIHMQAQVEHEKRLFDIEKERLDAEVEAGQITVRQKIAQLQQIADAEHAVTLDSLNQKRANVDAGDPRKDANERAKIDAQIEAETDAHDKKMAQLSAEAIKEMEAPYKQFFQQVSGQFNSFVDGIVVQHQKMRQAAQQLWRGLESDAINAILKVAEKYIEQHLVMAAAHKIFQATNKAVDVAAAAAHNAANATQAESDIGVSAAEVFFEAIEAIPFPANLVAAPAAAAEVWASGQPYVAAASAAGGWDMPSGGPFPMIGHSREMMLPEKHADTIRNLGESGSGHTFVFHQAPGSSPDNVRQSTRAFVDQIRKAARQGLLTPA